MVSFRAVNHRKKIYNSRKRHILYVKVAVECQAIYKKWYIVPVRAGYNDKRCRMASVQIKIKIGDKKKWKL